MEPFMRVMVMFDIPVKTKDQIKRATKFRSQLIKRGYFMMQFSVYMRVVRGMTSARAHIERLKGILPPEGNIRAIVVTERQFDNIIILLGDNNEQMKKSKPVQLTLF
ncbi:CRISPR-associated Cas2 family protein [Campylobacter hyointestinalis subsp. hyointestinalis]|nr:CRISPR-associated Cas2 family protein [Campylobacter hyointestinalis subsp. hyointestinalis]